MAIKTKTACIQQCTAADQGVTLIETIVYATILSILTVSLIASLLQINRSLQQFVISRIVDDTAQEVMEKLVREIRFADSVDGVQSVFGTTPGKLVLNSSTVGGSPIEIEFSISGNTLQLLRDSVVVGPLTPQEVTISELIFDYISTPNSEAIKISLVLTASRGKVQVEETFNTTTLLRGSY